MTNSTPPLVECEQIHAGLAVSDLSAAIEFYVKKLGFQLGFKWGEPPSFAGVNLGKVQIFLQEGTPTPNAETGAAYFSVGDADALYEFHRANGVEVVEEIGDRVYGIRDYVVKDLYGYCLVFGHYIYNAGPPIRIERVDVPVRLEKRLAGLLKDLGRTQAYECGQLSRGDDSAYERGRGTAYEVDAEVHRGAEEEAWDRLRQPWELSVR